MKPLFIIKIFTTLVFGIAFHESAVSVAALVVPPLKVEYTQAHKKHKLSDIKKFNLVKVRLATQLDRLKVRGFGLKIDSIRSPGFLNPMGFSTVHIQSIGQALLPKFRIYLDKKRTTYVDRKQIEIRAQALKINGEVVPSQITLHRNLDNKIDVVAEVPMDEYLASVIPAEMPAVWPMNAIKAQVVASRSYTMRQMSIHRNREFHVESNVKDQVFNYQRTQNLPHKLKAKIEQAIYETKGLILVERDQKQVLKAYFHAHCGGKTAHPNEVWQNGQQMGSVKCPHPRTQTWVYRLDRQQMEFKIKQLFGLPYNAQLESVDSIGPSDSGRVKFMQFHFSGIKPVRLNSQGFRKIFGFDTIKSAKFSTVWKNEELIVRGQGSGHGVGLCQWGAKRLARKGRSYRRILRHYYPGAQLISYASKSNSP